MRLRKNKKGIFINFLVGVVVFSIFALVQSINLLGTMKKVFTLFAIVGMFFFVSCGDSSQNKAQGEEDAVDAAEELLEEAEEEVEEVMEEAVEVVDSMANEMDSTEAEMDAPAVEGEEMETEEVEGAE